MIAVHISNPTVRCGFGRDYNAIWQILTAGGLADGADHTVAEDPGLRELGIDRKVARTTDKQARLLLAAAIDCIGTMTQDARKECGLYLGLPTVDEPMPQLDAVADWHEDRGRSPLAEHYKRHSSPLGCLAMLNSSAAAHISTRLQLTGSTGVYSPFGDAGLNALIDAAIAVAHGECVRALVGAVAPKHDPMLTLQYSHWCAADQQLPLAEGSACALLSSAEDAEGAHIYGYGRGFAPMPWSDGDPLATVIDSALMMAGLTREQIGWVLATSGWNASQEKALGQTLDPFAPTAAILQVERLFGRLGPAAPMFAIGLGLRGLSCGVAWEYGNDGNPSASALKASNLLVVSVSPHGQCAVVVIGGSS